MIGEIIRAMWCSTFHWAHHQFIGAGSFYRYGRKLYGELRHCRLCGREWIVDDDQRSNWE